MGKSTGFMEFPRLKRPWRDASERSLDYYEIYTPPNKNKLKLQGARCMNCGVPFCESDHGCPIDNLIPEWNDLVYKGRWREALERLSKTNNFPEFTGRVCPAPCEGACVLGINEPAVTIKDIENSIVDVGFEEGWIRPNIPDKRTGKSIAIIGSGPAGLTAADQLNGVGHSVTVFEREDRIGGLLMYGIPNMKLSKSVVNRRVSLLEDSGIVFKTNANIGIDIESETVLQSFDAVLIATGSTIPRDLDIPGRDSKNIHFAMDFLTQNTKSLLNSSLSDDNYIDAKDKNVIVIGGGDTGTDCIATAIRHGCKGLINLELLDQSPIERDALNPWPLWPVIHRTDYGHEEAIKRFGNDPREYATLSQEFIFDAKHNLTGLKTNEVKWQKNNGRFEMNIVEGKEKVWEADLVLLALGFIGPDQTLINQMGIDLDERNNISAAHGSFETSKEGVFTAGDCRRGQSLVVWAMNEGRGAALSIDRYLQGSSSLSAPMIKLGSEER
ncbi:MAG: glutamate synthase subunit beta [Gammaproteobacteria bacterium]|nr:glutamate synthase subunit beta [Gammaproteobacteria bacterium]